jgi:hypothetical protein
MKSLFVSRFAPEASTTDVEKSLLDQLKLSSLTCTKLNTKFKTYASFHISVTEEDFPSINNTGVWPNGCFIAPFYERLNPEQIYSPVASDVPVAAAPASPRDTVENCMNPKGDDGAYGGSS